jgi:hypothetical protein
MRPTTSETIRGIVRVLREVIAPELQSSLARDQLEHVIIALSQYDFEGVVPGLLAENASLAGVLTEWRESAAGQAAPAGLAQAVGTALAALAADAAGQLRPADVEPDAVRERNLAGRAALAEIAASAAFWTEDDEPELRQLIWQQVRAYPGGGYWRPGVRRTSR